jgi:hypothetical protein
LNGALLVHWCNDTNLEDLIPSNFEAHFHATTFVNQEEITLADELYLVVEGKLHRA